MELGVAQGVEGHEVVGHDAATTVNGALLVQRLELQRVGEMDAVLIGQLTFLQTVIYIHCVILLIALLVWLLDAAARGSVVVCDGEAYHRTVGQVDGALDEALAVGATANNHASVLVLYGTSDNLGSRGRIFVDQHYHLSIHKLTVSIGTILLAWYSAAVGVDDELVLGQKLVGNLDGCLQIAAAVFLQVKNQALHTLCVQLLKGIAKLLMGSGTEVADTDVADAGTNHVRSVDRLDGNLVADYCERQAVLDARADDAQNHLGVFGTTKSAHYLLLRHLHAGNGSIVDADDAVAGYNAHLFGGAVGDGLDDHQRVVNHVELHAYALEVAVQRFVHLLHLLGIGVGGVGVELLQHAPDGVLHELGLVDGVDIEVVGGNFGNL